MNNKFTMELVWHNCYSHPPKEFWNDYLHITDGEYVFEAKYNQERGWYIKESGEYLPLNILNKHWWADIEQTVQGEQKFKE